MKIDGAVAIVTGGTGVIGTEIGSSLRSRGARVVPWDLGVRSSDAIDCDVSNPDSVAAAFAETVERWGQPTILINSAGVSGGRAPWAEDADDTEWHAVLSPLEAWRSVFDVNVLGPVNTSREFARTLRGNRQPAAIVNITSITGDEVVDPALTAYSASKAAANAVTRSAAKNFGPLGIRVNAVSPGMMESRMSRSGVAAPVTSGPSDSTEMMERVLAGTPVENRFARASDISDAVLALLEMEFVTGQIVCVDGGLTLRSLSKPS